LVNLLAKFDVSSSYRSRDMEGVTKFQKYLSWPIPDPFDPILHFFR